MFDEFKELMSAFNARNVRYLIVGGYAVSLHAQPRSTQERNPFPEVVTLSQWLSPFPSGCHPFPVVVALSQ